MFVGFVPLEDSFITDVLTKDGGLPVTPDAAPAYAAYGPDGALPDVTGTLTATDDTVGLYRWSFAIAGSAGFEIGTVYTVLVTYSVSTAAHADVYHFGVV